MVEKVSVEAHLFLENGESKYKRQINKNKASLVLQLSNLLLQLVPVLVQHPL